MAEGSYAYELTYWRAGRPVFYTGDVVFRTGDLLGAVFVTSTGQLGLRNRTLLLAHRLAAQIAQVLADKTR